MRYPLLFAALSGCLSAAPITLTLKQALDMAANSNPQLIAARLDEQRAALEIRAISEPILPRVYAGSGLGYNNGFPLSIEGSAPSVVQAKAMRSVFNRPQSYQVLQARESARAAGQATAVTREDVALKTALAFLDLERLGRGVDIARRQIENLERVAEVVRLRVQEGREPEIESKKAALAVARAKHRVLQIENARTSAASALAQALGLGPDDEVRPAGEERGEMQLPPEPDAPTEALAQSPEIKRLEASLLAKNMESKGALANRLPRVDFIAEYALFARFNHYEDWFNTFQRHNGLVGVSIQVPLFTGSIHDARAGQAELEAQKIRTQIRSTRQRISAETKAAWDRVHEADAARDVARLDLDVARQSVNDLIAQTEEGRASLRQLEEGRYLENEKWLAFYDARYAAERARLELLKATSSLVAALR